MKKFEYLEFQNKLEEKKEERELKLEDKKLPFFSTEVPISSQKSESDEIITVTHNWNDSEAPWIRVKKAEYLKGEDLDGIYSINIRDGAEKAMVKKLGFSYVLRKASRIVARSLFSAMRKAKLCIEKVVGFLTTMCGNTYLISKISKGTWSFDKSIHDENVNILEIESLQPSEKDKMFEMVTEKMIELHSNRFLIKEFSMENIIMTDNDIYFADPRNLRTTRKLSILADEFKAVLKYFVSLGMSRGAAYNSIAVYTQSAKDATNEWYTEKTGKKAKDEVELASEFEKDLF
ncbi:MAG: hypothetical protein ABII22_00320 [Candidatus Micrarchaeota archaeon]